eukprot:TRINITY_DN7305_c0_g2_i1.p1 TRINITY_DN7305_c0_g2~~TRINITY_DN7305_c0_g2_i1.p1  ORF type:complete len:143 (+),score=16.38 TRINITY_DN7305_c0_g2_i1:62-430(+)
MAPEPIMEDYSTREVDRLIAEAEVLHPAALYTLAAKLLREGRPDEAVLWFYIGQIRYRFMLAVENITARGGATEGQPRMMMGRPSDGAILFSALSESVGRPINEYAFGEVDKAVEQINSSLE